MNEKMENQIRDYIRKLQEIQDLISDNDDDDDMPEDLLNNVRDYFESLSKDIVDFMGGKDSTSNLTVKFKKLDNNAIIPSYSKEGDAGLDLTVCKIIHEDPYEITYGYGLAVEIPKGYVGLVFPRSSIRKKDILLTNSVGVIDSGYRGEIQSTFKKVGGLCKKYDIGERASQLIIMPYPAINVVESSELSDTERGDGGFGSTGK